MILTERDITFLRSLVLIIDRCAANDPGSAKAIAMTSLTRLFLDPQEPKTAPAPALQPQQQTPPPVQTPMPQHLHPQPQPEPHPQG